MGECATTPDETADFFLDGSQNVGQQACKFAGEWS
jgi:hypothetical protein